MMAIHEPTGVPNAPFPNSGGPPALDPTSLLVDQLQAFDDSRSRCPIAVNARLGIAVLSHAEVVRILDDPETFSSAVSAHHAALPNGFDQPKHTMYREPINRYLTQQKTAEFDPGGKRVPTELVDPLPGAEPVEVMSHFAL